MNIAFLCIRDWDCGGTTRYITSLYSALIKKGVNVCIYVLNASGKPLKAYYKGLNSVIYLKCKNYKDNAKLLNKYDIIHLTDMGKYEDRKLDIPKYWSTIELLSKHKIIGTWHCSPNYTIKKYFPFGRKLESLCQLVYCVRKHKGLIYLPHLIDCSDVCYSNKKNIVISTARVTSSKGQIYLFKATPKIKGQVNIYSWCRNRYTYDMQNMVEFKSKNLKVFPEYKYEDVHNIMKDAVVLCNFSYYDGIEKGTEYCILEAMKYGVVPIVDKSWCSGNSILKENINVIGVDRKNINEISDKINKLLSNKKKQEFIVKNNFGFLKLFDSNIVVNKYIKFYKWFLCGRKKR